MNIKLMGAVCVIVACGSCGFIMASQHLSKIRLFRNLIFVLDYMQCELQYRCTYLPELCRKSGEQVNGIVQQVFLLLADELDGQISPNAYRCVSAVLDKLGAAETAWGSILLDLGKYLGKFDMEGQLQGLEHARNLCRENLEKLIHNKEGRLRSYQTLGLCAGAAIAILFV